MRTNKQMQFSWNNTGLRQAATLFTNLILYQTNLLNHLANSPIFALYSRANRVTINHTLMENKSIGQHRFLFWLSLSCQACRMMPLGHDDPPLHCHSLSLPLPLSFSLSHGDYRGVLGVRENDRRDWLKSQGPEYVSCFLAADRCLAVSFSFPFFLTPFTRSKNKLAKLNNLNTK